MRNYELEKAQKELALAELNESEARAELTMFESYAVFPENQIAHARFVWKRAIVLRELAQIAVDEITARS